MSEVPNTSKLLDTNTKHYDWITELLMLHRASIVALIEGQKDLSAALHILQRIRDAMRNACVFVELDHIYRVLKQYVKSMERVSNSIYLISS